MSRIKMKKLIPIVIGLFLVVPCWAKAPTVKLETNFGDIVIELFDANAPLTVGNFMGYVKSGFYDGLIFHRVIADFAIQSGGFDTDLNDPNTRDPIPNESNNGLKNLRSTVAMARGLHRDSATSQFYINVVDNNSLDWKDPNEQKDPNDVGYCVFGRVISDMNVIDRIADLPTEDHVPPYDLNDVPQPPGPVIIYHATILGNFDNDPNVNFIDYSIFTNQWLDSGESSPFEVTASDGSEGDWFGFAIAVDDNVAIIGAPKDNDNTGSAYIFEYIDGNWTQQAKLTATDSETGDYFGGSVSISTNHAIIGAPGANDFSGSAYIFEYNDGNWTQQTKLWVYEDDPGDWFGQSVSISGDCVIVGARLDDLFASDAGSAYIYYRHHDGTNNWGLQFLCGPLDTSTNDNFGYSVSINGEYALIGAIGDNPANEDPDISNFTGSAYIYKHDGTSWIQWEKLTASDGEKLDKFGSSVSTDGYFAIVGARLDDDNGDSSGSAYIFEPNGLDPNDPNKWDQIAKLTASDGAADDYFGCSVAIGAGRALVGAYGDDDNGSSSGSVYIFEPNDPNSDNWEEIAKLTASDAAADDYFGSSVAIGMSRRAIVGAYGNDDSGSESGSAYIMTLCPDADLDGDCRITLNDLAVFANNWLWH